MDAGIGEAALISAAIGAGTGAVGSAAGGGDPLKGALRGALMGGVTGGLGAGISGLGSAATAATEVASEAAPLVTDASIVGDAGLKGLDQTSLDFIKANPQLYPTAANGSLATSVSMTPTNPVPLNASDLTSAPYGAEQAQNIVQNMQPTTLSGINPQSITGEPLPSGPTITANNPPTPASKGLFDFGYKGTPTNAFGYGPQSNMGLGAIGVTSGLTAAMQAERDKYAPPGLTPYTGILSKYDPYTAKGVQYPTHYAEGGIASLGMQRMDSGGITDLSDGNYATVEQMSRANSLGGNQMFPQSGIGGLTGANTYQNPTNTPMETSVIGPTDTMTDKYSGQMSFARGGMASSYDLGSYSDGGRLLRGPGDGMSDNIPASIADKQPARLADGEFVVPADVVSHLGNGSTDAGAKNLYKMMNKVRKARTGNPKQGKQINPGKYIPA